MEEKELKSEESSSNENEETKEVQKEEPKENLSRKEQSLLKKKEEELEKALHDVEYWKNEYYRAYADMANLRKDIEKDHKEAIKYRLEDFVENILGVLDAFDMAFRAKPQNEETQNYLKGFEYVYRQLLSVLESEGIKEITPNINDKFDEKTMHAVDTVKDDGEENLVKSVTLRGYKLHDHLVRAAMVVVSKHPSSNDVKENETEKDDEAKNA